MDTLLRTKEEVASVLHKGLAVRKGWKKDYPFYVLQVYDLGTERVRCQIFAGRSSEEGLKPAVS